MCRSNWWLTTPGLALFPTLWQLLFPGVGDKCWVQTRPLGWSNPVLMSGGRETKNVMSQGREGLENEQLVSSLQTKANIGFIRKTPWRSNLKLADDTKGILSLLRQSFTMSLPLPLFDSSSEIANNAYSQTYLSQQKLFTFNLTGIRKFEQNQFYWLMIPFKSVV